MASGPEGTEPVNYQTWVLKVSIHCEGCKKKIKKILHKVKGVYSIDVDAQQNRVTVTGNVDAQSLIQKLLKYGKHAELLPDKNPSAVPAVKSEAKGKEKAVSAAAATAEPETEEKKKEEKGKAVESPETPPETEDASGEVAASKPDTDKPEKNISDKPAASDADSKKKGKEVKREENNTDEREVSDLVGVAGSNPPPTNSFPANFQPIYTTMSYHTANPSTSYAYYATPPPEMPSSYAYYGDLPPPPAYAPPAGYSPEYYYSSESYYRSMDQPSSSAGSYDMFNDENPNACKLM